MLLSCDGLAAEPEGGHDHGENSNVEQRAHGMSPVPYLGESPSLSMMQQYLRQTDTAVLAITKKRILKL